jgi:hypothetical protein
MRGSPDIFGRNGFSHARTAQDIFKGLARQDIESETGRPQQIPLWLEPPLHFSERQQTIWRNAVLTRGVEWFAPADALALEQYVFAYEDLIHFRAQAHMAHWDHDSEMRFRRSQQNFRAFSRMLGLTIEQRVSFAVRRNQDKPSGKVNEDLREQATAAAEDQLLHGYAPLDVQTALGGGDLPPQPEPGPTPAPASPVGPKQAA